MGTLWTPLPSPLPFSLPHTQLGQMGPKGEAVRMGVGGGVGAAGLRERGAGLHQTRDRRGLGVRLCFLCWIISFQQFYCNYPENAAIYRVSQTAAVPGGRGNERMGGRAQGGGGRRGQERKGNQTGRRVAAWGGGRRLELRQRSQNSSLRENQLGREKGLEGPAGSQDLGSRPPCGQWAQGPQGKANVPRGSWEAWVSTY